MRITSTARTAAPTTATDVSEILHAGALGASALGACCVAVDAARPRRREFVLMALMVLAMLDIVTGAAVLSMVWWAAAIVGVSVALAVRRRRAEPEAVSGMRLHAALGGIVMAALMLVMSAGHPSSAQASHHGVSANGFIGVLAAAAVVLAASSVWRTRRGHPLERAQYASSAASLLLLAGAVLA